VAVPKKPVRGLRNIRTLSGRVDRSDSSYRLYVKLGALGREKVRLAGERESTVRRLGEIDQRLQGIAREESLLLGSVVDGEGRDVSEEEVPPVPPAAAPVQEERRKDPAPEGFRFRY
jgi:hypothetical protein